MEFSKLQMRDAFIEKLYKRAIKDKNIIFISNEFGSESLDKFRSDLPEQFINAGISEQNIISVAAGMAIQKKKVFVYSIASFITLRCFEQIKLDICAMNLPVTIIGVGTCYSYCVDGPSHHATEDISIMRSLSGMNIYSPADSNIAAGLVDVALNSRKPVYIRLDREKLPIFYSIKENINSGYKVLKEGKDICFISTGIMTHKAFEAVTDLEKFNFNIKIIDIYRLKPVHHIDIIKEIKNFKIVVTLEEHTLNGGLGSIISEILHDNNINIKLKRLGIKEELLYSYNLRNDNHKKNEIDKDSIIELIKNLNFL